VLVAERWSIAEQVTVQVSALTGPKVYEPGEPISQRLQIPYYAPFISFVAYDIAGTQGVVLDIMAMEQPAKAGNVINLVCARHPPIQALVHNRVAQLRIGSSILSVDPRRNSISSVQSSPHSEWADLALNSYIPFSSDLVLDATRDAASRLYNVPLDTSVPVSVLYLFDVSTSCDAFPASKHSCHPCLELVDRILH
jgi:hypothetical protein